MNRLTINLAALQTNIATIDNWLQAHGASWTLVTKVLCGHSETLRALQGIGIRSMGDSRLTNIRAIDRVAEDFEAWYLRLPHQTAIPEIVELTDVSLNSEIETIAAINEEAKRRNKIHRIIVMIELGDLREGVLPGGLIEFYDSIFRLSNIEVIGIGANLGCLSGAIPSVDQYTQLALYRELLELKFGHTLPFISAGTSIALPLMLRGEVPKAINHFRIGDSVFLGTDLINGGRMEGLRDDAFILEAEIAEIREKNLIPMGETGTVAPFGDMTPTPQADSTPGQRGFRAVLTMGALDTDIGGLTPINPSHEIAGTSSDVMVVNLGDDEGGLRVGDSIKFKPNYPALLRLMSGKYLEQKVIQNVDFFTSQYKGENDLPRLITEDMQEDSPTDKPS